MKVLKFGGTSVGSPEAIASLIQILKKYYAQNTRLAVVFSAFSKVTDALIGMARTAATGNAAYQTELEKLRNRHFDAIEKLLADAPEDFRKETNRQIFQNFNDLAGVLQGIFLLREVSPRSLDFVCSFGERNSTYIIAQAMSSAGIPTDFLDAREVVRTDDQFTAARVDFDETNRRIRQHFLEHPNVQAVTGFVGSTADGLTTTLGRGGSDYTAAILGAALDAEVIEIWTDVDGVLTADPRRVKKAFTLPAISYREAMEMSHFGAKVIYPPTILPALTKEIPILIKNTFNADFKGTYIGTGHESHRLDHAITGISSINQICLLTLQGSGLFGVPGISARLFGALARAGANVVIITQGSSESSITFAVSPEQADLAKAAVEREFQFELRDNLVEPLRIERDLAVVAIVGEGMRFRPGIAGQLFAALGKNGVNIVAIAQGSSELNITIVVAARDETKTLNAIHESFFLSDVRTLHLFVVGVGGIGSTLLRQIARQSKFLQEKRKLEIKIVGLANSKRMIFSENGLDLDGWAELLRDSAADFSISRFVEKMRQFNLPNTIFIDNTASSEVAAFYEQILDASISISTPNKLAASGSFLQYEKLKKIAEKRGVEWRYETNVGAGLPIITTLNDLIHSGDQILKIEGVLSGTLSFIFNHFKSGSKFSEIVREAKQRGLTEPDPRDDLSGSDVRRKLLILARESGLPMESGDIQLEQILPADCLAPETVEGFFEALEQNDGHFERLRQIAENEGKVLRLVAKLEDGRATIGLQKVGIEHPFYFLSGSDNMVVFTSERYHERPLVVRGPGAGAEVTAAGVFAEVIALV